MRFALPAAVIVVAIAAACGKVGDPKPPINRTPLAANTVRLGQSGTTLTLSWINPGRYIDNNEVNDLAFVRILRNGVEIAREKAQPAGKPQSYPIDVSRELDLEVAFSVQVETQRGRVSTPSETVRIRPKNIPGAPQKLVIKVDQERIILDWAPPQLNPDLAEVYLVQRSDRPAPIPVMGTHLEDQEFEPEKKYEYTVTAARAGDPLVPGTAGASASVTAKDETPPEPPTGLAIESLSPGVVFVAWDFNKERDVSEYRVYRSDQADPIFTRSTKGVADPNYRPGLTYQVVAVDKSGNESGRSEAKGGP